MWGLPEVSLQAAQEGLSPQEKRSDISEKSCPPQHPDVQYSKNPASGRGEGTLVVCFRRHKDKGLETNSHVCESESKATRTLLETPEGLLPFCSGQISLSKGVP